MNKKNLIIISVTILFIGLVGFNIYKNLYYLTFINKIEDSDNKVTYALFKHDYIFANPNFYVFRFDIETEPENLTFKSPFNKNRTQEEYNKMMDNVILENYEEDNSKANNPKIKIIDDNFLVMERGQFYYALYDLKKNKAIFNDCCPFSHWGSQNIWSEKGTYYKGEIKKDEKSDYGIWTLKNIHEPILKYIEEKK